MTAASRKQIEQLKEGLVKNLTLDFFDEEEVSSILRDIESLDQRLRQKVLALCLALSHASSSLVPGALERIKRVSHYFPVKEAEKWITSAFDLLDSKGIDAFMNFISQTDEESLRAFQHPEGLRLQEVAPILEIYLKGVSGLDLRIASNKETYTDTVTVYLLSSLNRFREPEKNFLLYKLMAVFKWAQIAGGTLTPGEETVKTFLGEAGPGHPDIETFFRLFPDRQLAVDLYNVLEAVRLDTFLQRELPGLMREAEGIRAALLEERVSTEELSEKTAFVEGLYQYFLAGEIRGPLSEPLKKVSKEMLPLKEQGTFRDTMKILFEVYGVAKELNGDYAPPDPPLLLGTIKPEKVSQYLKGQRRARKKMIEGVITKLLQIPEFEPKEKPFSKHPPGERPVEPRKEYLLLKGRLIELDSELREILEERGGIPGGILVKGADFGAGSPVTFSDLLEEEEEAAAERGGGIKYDEWDYRRGGYKRHWCTLYEQDIQSGHEPFVDLTLKRYGGYVTVLRKKFELLKREPKILRRQKEGDDIDIDAIIEAFSDIRAGISPGEDLFTRLDRQERNIAVLFLLDMSGSTKGWVNVAEKEALVLMCEALETLGDRYAIYGFSGMTRTRCDFYKIKGFEETYSETVKKRISGISPKDYTRMGPPIRHSIQVLKYVEARTKLLITLSDGKPEDWDAYKGDYGIEDTRKALIEAKEQGVHSFCITIDKEAGSYLPHMYGEVNYIFIDDVKKLPNKMTEIYRRLTT